MEGFRTFTSYSWYCRNSESIRHKDKCWLSDLNLLWWAEERQSTTVWQTSLIGTYPNYFLEVNHAHIIVIFFFFLLGVAPGIKESVVCLAWWKAQPHAFEGAELFSETVFWSTWQKWWPRWFWCLHTCEVGAMAEDPTTISIYTQIASVLSTWS